MKDIVFDCIKRTSDVMCVWDCCWLWIRTAEVKLWNYCCYHSLLHALLSGSFYHCFWSLHGAVHHPVYRGECSVHECRPLRCGIWWNVSITSLFCNKLEFSWCLFEMYFTQKLKQMTNVVCFEKLSK